MPTTLISGANRGIGLELARQYLADGWRVIATCRHPDSATELQALAQPTLEMHALDVTDHGAIDGLAGRLEHVPIDLLLNNAGIIGPVPVAEHIERQHFGNIDYELWQQVLHTNTFAPIKMAEALLPNVLAGEKKKIVTLSSTVGSITERDTPAFAYATSKAAVNKAMTVLASQLRPQGVIVALMCPGYVKTRLNFGTADVEAQDSVAGMRALIGAFTLADTGSFRRYNGDVIGW